MNSIFTFSPAELRHCGHGEINARRKKWLPNRRSLRRPHGNQRRTNPHPSHTRNDKFSAHIKLVGRNQIIILRSPARVSDRTLTENICATGRRCDVQRMRPWIEVSIANYGKHAGQREVIIALGDKVFGISFVIVRWSCLAR